MTKSQIQVPTVDPNEPLNIDKYTVVSEEPTLEKENRLIHILSLTFFILIFFTAVAFMYFLNNDKSGENIEPKAVPIVSNVSESMPIFKREEITIEVRNASGRSGVASAVSGKLNTLGYSSYTSKKTYPKQKDSVLLLGLSTQKFSSLVINDFEDVISDEIGVSDLTEATPSAVIIVGSNYK